MNILQQTAPFQRSMALRLLKGSPSLSRQFYRSTSISSTYTPSLSYVLDPNQIKCHKQQPQRDFHSTSVPHLFPSDSDNISLLPSSDMVDTPLRSNESQLAGSRAFVECDRTALIDLFDQYAKLCDVSGKHLDRKGLSSILKAVGENPQKSVIDQLFKAADVSGDGLIQLEVRHEYMYYALCMVVIIFCSHTFVHSSLFHHYFYLCVSRQEFLISSDSILGNSPARIVLIVGGPGSGKGMVSKRLERECGVVHLSSGDLLRDEVSRETVLGKQVQGIMERGELVSSAVIVTLIRRVMRNHPGKRVLLDGFPRSLQNAHDLVALCGVPELALHLECDDTILMERIIHRGKETDGERSDDNFHTALKRLRTYHKSHHSTMQWLREQHVPVVNLDCSGTPDNVWNQLVGIGRLMRSATKIGEKESEAVARAKLVKDQAQAEEASKPDAA